MPTTLRNTDILFNDGTTQSTAAAASSFVGFRGQAFTSNGTFTIPTGITAVKVTVVGGGGGSAGSAISCGGGGGGAAISFLTSLTPGNTLAVTVGAGGGLSGAGGTSSVASGTQSITTISATGGAAGAINNTVGAAGGVGSNGTLNIRGQASSPVLIINACTASYSGSFGGSSILGGGGFISSAGGAFGGGAGMNGVTGGAGVVIFEW